jgi:hypothetical protein
MPSIEDLDDDEEFQPIYNDNDYTQQDKGYDSNTTDKPIEDLYKDEEDWIYEDLFKGTNKRMIREKLNEKSVRSKRVDPDDDRWEDRRL